MGTPSTSYHRATSVVVDVLDFIARVALGVALALLIAAAVPLALGWRSDVVLSGSMMPGIRPGDVVATESVDAAEVEVGQVLLVDNPARPGSTLIHRVVEDDDGNGSLITQGDANAMPDSTPVPPSAVRGRARLIVPYAGLPRLWLDRGERPKLIAFVVAMAALILMVRSRKIPAEVLTSRPEPPIGRESPPGSGVIDERRSTPRQKTNHAGRHRSRDAPRAARRKRPGVECVPGDLQ